MGGGGNVRSVRAIGCPTDVCWDGAAFGGVGRKKQRAQRIEWMLHNVTVKVGRVTVGQLKVRWANSKGDKCQFNFSAFGTLFKCLLLQVWPFPFSFLYGITNDCHWQMNE